MGTLKRFPNPPATRTPERRGGEGGVSVPKSPEGTDSAGGPGSVHTVVMGTLEGFPNPPATDSAGGPGSVHAINGPVFDNLRLSDYH